MNIRSGRWAYSGINGYGWSSRANSSDPRYAYRIYFNNLAVNLSNDGYRFAAFPLRCSSIDSNNIRSGGLNIESGRLWNSGTNGYSWSLRSLRNDIRKAHYLYFNTSSVYSSSYGDRLGAFPLRCLARQ